MATTTVTKVPPRKLTRNKNENATSSKIAPLIAGFSGGAASTVLLYPLDLIKVRWQVDETTMTAFGRLKPSNATSSSAATPKAPKPASPIITPMHHRKSTLHALRSVIKYEGFLGLYMGLTPALVGSAVSWGGYFYVYEQFKGKLLGRTQKKNLNSMENFACACSAGACMVLLTNPIWLIKTRMQLQHRKVPSSSKAKPYTDITHAIHTIIREEGILALYKGAIPAMMLTVNGGIQFVSYEFLKLHFGNYVRGKRGRGGRTVSQRFYDSVGYLTMGAVSKMIASTATYPLQVIKSRLQQRSHSVEISETGKAHVVKRTYSGLIDCIKRIWIHEGFIGFFKGCAPNVLRVAPNAAITFVVYEGMMDLLVGEHHRL